MSFIFTLFLGVWIMHPSTGEYGLHIVKHEKPLKSHEECVEQGQIAALVIQMQGLSDMPVVAACHKELAGKDT